MNSIYIKVINCILLALVLSSAAYGQGEQLSTRSKKAIKFYHEGENAFHQYRNLELAQLSYQSAVNADSNFVEAQMMLGYVFLEQQMLKKALVRLRKAAAINADINPNMLYSIGDLEMDFGNYEKARTAYRQFISFPNISPKYANEAKLDLMHIDFAINGINNPVDFDPINMGDAINTPLDEYFPCITADDYTFIYTRKLKSEMNPMGYNEDFYVSFNQEGWQKSLNMGYPINSENNEGAPTLSADGQVLVFTACELFGNYGSNRKGYGSCDLFVTRLIGNKWSEPVNLGAPINTKNWETQPSISSDGRTLYFVRGVRTRAGVKGQDIFVTHYTDAGEWTVPTKLNSNINTDFVEESVFIHPDGQTIYFSSNGHPGMGNLDIFMSKKDENGEWGPAINLGYPINTSSNENSLLVDAKGVYGYFASSREGGKGGLDLYYFELPEKMKPEPVTYLKGKVFDAKTKKPLSTKFELIDLETGEKVVQAYSNKGNGRFLIAIPSGKNYALNASKSGYLFYSDNFSLEGIDDTEPFNKDVPLQPIEIGEKVILKNIFFDTDKYDLKPASEVELGKLIAFLNENPTLNIELSGHTDNVGDDSYNQKLSENRAKAVYSYLVDKGIQADRLAFKGYGESAPIASNDSPKGRAKNRRTEFKIVAAD